MESLFGCLSLFLILLALAALVGAWIVVLGVKSRVRALETETRQLRTANEIIKARLLEVFSLLDEKSAGGSEPGGPEAPQSDIRTASLPEEAPEVHPEAVAPPAVPETSAAFETLPVDVSEDLTPEGTAPPGPPIAEREDRAAHEAAAVPPPGVPPPEDQGGPPSPPVPPKPHRSFDWESVIGVNLFSWIAGFALALSAILFLRYSVEHGWLQPWVRFSLGFVTGTALLVANQMKFARRYRVTSNALDAAGIAILYASLFAAHALWHLLPSTLVFALMIVVTAIAVILSIQRESIFIALLGLLGGFATPALLSSGEDHPFGLFGYLLMLNAGLGWVSYRKRWPVLSALTLLFTTLYQWGWVTRFLESSKLPIAVGVFLVFPIVAVAGIWIARPSGDGEEKKFESIAAFSSALPLVFAVYFAAAPAYGARFGLLFFFLLLVDAGLAAIAISRRGPEVLHLLGALTTVLTFGVWCAFSYRSAAWPAMVFWIAAFVALYLIADLVAGRLGRRFEGAGALAAYAAPLLLFVFAFLGYAEPKTAAPALLFSVLFVLVAANAWGAIRSDDGRIFHLATAAALAAEAIWSAKHLAPATLTSALVIYAAFALLTLAVPVVARRRGKELRPAIASPLMVIGSLLLLFFLTGAGVAAVSLGGLAVLLIIANLGLFASGAAIRHPLLAAVAAVLSWLVLVAWWIAVPLAVHLVPALSVIAGFSVLLLGANVVLQRSGRADERPESQQTLYLALAGHLFLLVVAMNPSLSVPPWPMLAVLGVIDLAVGVTVLFLGRARLLGAAMVASQLVLVAWASSVTAVPWPQVAVWSALVVAAFAGAWIFAAERRLGSECRLRFSAAAAGAILIGHFVVIAAGEAAAHPTTGMVTLAHVLLLAGMLLIAARASMHYLAIFEVVPFAIAIFLWMGETYQPAQWGGEMFLATVLYLMFIAYPLLLGRRGKAAFEPALASAFASIPFFFFARTELMRRGLGDAIGLLPLAQAALLLAVLWMLLRIEEPGKRNNGRLAMVAGSALAFITVAIPLQLEKEWITVAWALEAAALLWLFLRIPHRGLLYWSAALYSVVFVRLVFNPAVFGYHARSPIAIWNWYLYAYLVAAAAFFAGTRLLGKTGKDSSSLLARMPALLASGGTVLLFLLLNIEIADYFSKGSTITFTFSAGFAQDLTYTVLWGVFAVGMLVAGIITGSRGARIASIGLLLVSVLKAFLHDLIRLGGLYRVGSLLGLAIALAFVALLLQRYILVKPEPEKMP
ncbi:MAG: DUF2339 domain-containing protein [Thermoanaerobaculia bacterium]